MCKVCSSINGRAEAEVRGWKAPGCVPPTDHLSHPQAMTTKDLYTDTEEEDELPGCLPPFSPPKKPAGPLSEEEEFELIAKWQAGGLTLGQPRSSAVTDVTVKYKSREDLLNFETCDEETGDEDVPFHDLYAVMDDVDQTCDRMEDDFAALAPAMEGDHHFFFFDEDDPNFRDDAEEDSWDHYEYPTTLYPYTKENGGVWYTTEDDGYQHDQGLTEESDGDNSGSLEKQQRVSSGYLSADLSFEQSSRDGSTQFSDSVYIPKGWEKFPREIARQKFDLKKDPALPSLKAPSVVEEEPRPYRRARSERGEADQWEVSLADEILQAEGLRSGYRRHRRTSREHHRPRILDLRRRSRHDSGPIPGSVRMPSLRDKLEEYQRELEVHPRRSEPQSRRSSLATTMTGWDMTSMSYCQSQAETATEDGVRRRRSAHHHHRSSRRESYVSAATTPRPSRPSSGRSHRHRHGKNKDRNHEWKVVAVVGCVIAIGVLIWGLYGHGSTKTTPIKLE